MHMASASAFNSETPFGFHWDLVAKTVTFPDKKRMKYISRLSPWTAGYTASKSEIEVLIDTLNHVTPVVLDGRAYLPSLYRFPSSFPPNAPPFLKHKFPSWGVGLSLDGKWLAWEFLPGWNTNGRHIGWAEMVAVELAVRTLISGGHSNSHIILHSNNQGVIGSIRSGRSQNSEQKSYPTQDSIVISG
jgi:hypothetical protein